MRVLLSFAMLLLLAVPASAEGCMLTTSSPEIATCWPLRVGLVGECEYIDNDFCQPDCLFSIWFYGESNGIEGLQRFDEVVDDTCGGIYDGDTIWS